MKLPSTKISNYMVAKTIGVGSLSVRVLCRHKNINKWSKWKPFNRVVRASHALNGLEFVKEVGEDDLMDSRYGLQYPSMTAIPTSSDNTYCDITFPVMLGAKTEDEARKATIFYYETIDGGNAVVNADGQFYGKPNGVIRYTANSVEHEHYSPCRLSDFHDYDHAAKPPFYADGGLEEIPQYDENGSYLGINYRLTLKATRPSEDYGGLTPNDMKADFVNYPNDYLSDWYLGVLIYNRYGTEAYGIMKTVEGAEGRRNSLFYEIGQNTTSFVFEMTYDYMNILANHLAGGSGVYAVIPIIARQAAYGQKGNITVGNTILNDYYPSLQYDNNSFLPIENGVWWFTRMAVDSLTLCGNPKNVNDMSYIDSSISGLWRFVYGHLDAETNEEKFFPVSYTTNEVWADSMSSSNTNYYGNKALVYGYASGVTVYADSGMKDLVASSKRKITIGDYNTGAKFYMQQEIELAQAGFVRPLFQCKIKTEEGILDGMMYLWFVASDSTKKAPANVHIQLTVPGLGYNGAIAISQNLKSITLQNMVDGAGRIVGCQIDVYTIEAENGWDDFDAIVNVIEDEDPAYIGKGYIAKTTFTYTAATPMSEGNFLYPYIDPVVSTGSAILDSHLLPSMTNKILEVDYATVRFSVDGVEVDE